MDDIKLINEKWHELFKNTFGKDYDKQVKYLNLCGCLSHNWKENYKHAIHKKLNGETYSAVQELIRMIYYTKQDNLLISDLLLTYVPTTIESLSNLRMLTLDELDVHSLPVEVGNLVNLEMLTVTKCPLYSIPDWIGNLTKLHTLNVSRCKVEEVSPLLAKCTEIDTMNLGFNMLEYLPTEVLQMSSVQTLILDCNPLNIDFLQVGNMLPGCLFLSIMQTNTKSLPDSLLGNIRHLIWNGCKLIKFPIQVLSPINRLDLSNNEIEHMPVTLDLLPQLQYINLSNNHFLTKPEALEKLPQHVRVVYKHSHDVEQKHK